MNETSSFDCSIAKCRHDAEYKGLVPINGMQRFMKCTICFTTYWWDGPSILLPDRNGRQDPCRKLNHSDNLIPLTDEQADVVKRRI